MERLHDRVLPSAAAPKQPPPAVTTPIVLGSIEGTVTAMPGAAGGNVGAVPIQLIELVGFKAPVVATAATDDLGRFEFANLKPGAYAVREAGQISRKPDAVFLNGAPVDVGDIDLATGGPYPATHVAYKSNATVLTADAPGPTVLTPIPGLANPGLQSMAAGLFEDRANLLREIRQPSNHNFAGNQAIIDGSYYGLKTLIRLLA